MKETQSTLHALIRDPSLLPSWVENLKTHGAYGLCVRKWKYSKIFRKIYKTCLNRLKQNSNSCVCLASGFATLENASWPSSNTSDLALQVIGSDYNVMIRCYSRQIILHFSATTEDKNIGLLKGWTIPVYNVPRSMLTIHFHLRSWVGVWHLWYSRCDSLYGSVQNLFRNKRGSVQHLFGAWIKSFPKK
jgi:hypothetical protein